MTLRLEHVVYLKQLGFQVPTFTILPFHPSSFWVISFLTFLPTLPSLSISCQDCGQSSGPLIQSGTLGGGSLRSSCQNHTEVCSRIHRASVSIHSTIPSLKSMLASSRCRRSSVYRAGVMAAGSWHAHEDKSRVEEGGEVMNFSKFNLGLVALTACYRFQRDGPVS